MDVIADVYRRPQTKNDTEIYVLNFQIQINFAK